MQIVRDLAGYTMGRSDLLRSAMSKKKLAVMEKERKNFIYGNEEEGIPGCIHNGIEEAVAKKIYDDMIDFAKYAFNKSHAVAYAVVSYQTAWLKYYYPVEFMAALLTSVIDNASKVSEYILTCRQMGIAILPPDVNESEGVFSVSGSAIRYGMNAVKSVGRNVVDSIVKEREEKGLFTSLENFIDRLSGKELNKRTVEHLIKSGAFDSMEGTRKQMVAIYGAIMDQVSAKRKKSVEGQMSLFDFAAEEDKKEFEIKLPDIGEYTKEMLLAFEKEVLGFYISGHPMEEYEAQWKANVTARTTDFMVDEETGECRLHDGKMVWIGGMITGKTVKTTRTNNVMAFIHIEDMVGAVEVILFPRQYDRYREILIEDNKVFVSGRVSVSEEENGKLVCEKIVQFTEVPKQLWVQFEDMEDYKKRFGILSQILKESEGNDSVGIFLAKEKAKKLLPANQNVQVNPELLEKLYREFSEKNIKVMDKSIENISKMN